MHAESGRCGISLLAPEEAGRSNGVSSKLALQERLAATRHAAQQVRKRITCVCLFLALLPHVLVPVLIMGWVGVWPFKEWPPFLLMAPMTGFLHLAALTILPMDVAVVRATSQFCGLGSLLDGLWLGAIAALFVSGIVQSGRYTCQHAENVPGGCGATALIIFACSLNLILNAFAHWYALRPAPGAPSILSPDAWEAVTQHKRDYRREHGVLWTTLMCTASLRAFRAFWLGTEPKYFALSPRQALDHIWRCQQ
eukprot:2093687-Prymnesium_polylepis.1